jgi:hypothetical protein
VISPLAFLSDSSARVALIAAAILALLTYITLFKAALPIREFGGANIPQKLARSKDPEAAAGKAVGGLRSANLTGVAVKVFIVDFAFLSAFFLTLCLACEAAARSPVLAGLGSVSRLMGWLALLGAAADIIEDSAWLSMLRRQPYAPLAHLAAWSTRVKLAATGTVLVYIAGCALLWAVRRARPG